MSEFIENPGINDVTVGSIISDAMYDDLEKEMKKVNWEGVDKTREFWQNDYKNRKIISGKNLQKKIA